MLISYCFEWILNVIICHAFLLLKSKQIGMILTIMWANDLFYTSYLVMWFQIPLNCIVFVNDKYPLSYFQKNIFKSHFHKLKTSLIKCLKWISFFKLVSRFCFNPKVIKYWCLLNKIFVINFLKNQIFRKKFQNDFNFTKNL